MIVVEYNSEILGKGEFWRGTKDRISEIRNLPARQLAGLVAKDEKTRTDGMWTVRIERDQPK